jgi:hypothetical protein
VNLGFLQRAKDQVRSGREKWDCDHVNAVSLVVDGKKRSLVRRME